jgi:hypothetical protein
MQDDTSKDSWLRFGVETNFVEKVTFNSETPRVRGDQLFEGTGCFEHQNFINSNSVALVTSVPNCSCTDLYTRCTLRCVHTLKCKRVLKSVFCLDHSAVAWTWQLLILIQFLLQAGRGVSAC